MAGIKTLVSQTLIYGAGTIIPRLLNYALLTPFYVRVFQKDDYGSLNILYTFIAFFLVLLTYGMETTFFRFSSTEDDKNKVFSTASISLLATGIPFMLFVFLFKEQVADWLKYEDNPSYIVWMSIIVGLDVIYAIPFARLREKQQALRFMFIKLINVAVLLFFNFFFLYWCKNAYESQTGSWLAQLYSPDISVGYILIANLIASTVVLILLLPEYFSITWKFDFALWKRMLKYALPLLLVGLAAMINEMADKLFLQRMIEPEKAALEQIGIYAANYKIAILMTLFIQMFKYAAEPFFFSQAKERHAKSTYASVMNYFVIFGICIFLFITLFLDWIKYFIAEPYFEGLKIVPIVVLANLFLGIYYNLSVWYKLTSKTHLGAYISIGGAIVTIAINYIFIPYYGYLASAWATFTVYGLMMLASWILGQRFFKIDYPIKKILFYFAVGLSIYQLYLHLSFQSSVVKAVCAALLLLGFISLAFFIEKKKLKADLRAE